jgi:hypothetical protein
MKKLALIASALVCTATLGAEELTTQMLKSETGLNNIQKGFLYNSMELVKKGALEVKHANKIFHNQEATKKYLPEKKQHFSNIAFNAAKRIDVAADEMTSYLEANEMTKAQHAYSDIINACGSCHAVVRGW